MFFIICDCPVAQPCDGTGVNSCDPDAPGETEGNLELTLFGPAMTYFRPLLESVWHGLESIEPETGSTQAADRPGILLQNWHCLVPVPGQGVRFLEYPFAEPHYPGCNLEDWIRSDRFAFEPADRIQLDCITPLDIHTKKSAMELSFQEIIKAVIRRMRDLKRAYGKDSLMGEFSREFYTLAETIRIETEEIRRVSWYAPNPKGKRIPLHGLLGEIHIQGKLAPFLSFLQAGALIGVGANITYGLGRIGLAKGIGF